VAGSGRAFEFGTVGFFDNLASYLEWLRVAEDTGYDLAGYGDTQNLIPDMFVGLTAAAMSTSHIRLASIVTNPVTRHPSVMASGASALQAVSGGRFSLGIATGDSALRNIGERPATVDQLEAYVRAVRGLGAGDEVEWNGRTMRLEWPVEPVPIWITAEGPRMMDLAGRLGDGVIFGNGLDREVIEDNIRRVEAGARSAGRDPREVEMWFLVKPHFAPSESAGWTDVSWTLAASANHAFRHSMDDKFVPAELQPAIRRLIDGYRSAEHNRGGAASHNGALVEDNGLLEFLGRRFLIAGNPADIGERLQMLGAWGATKLIFPSIHGDKVGYTRRLWREVLEPLR